MTEVEKSFTTDKYVVTHSVSPDEEGWRLDQFLQKCMPTLSRQFLKKKIGKNEVLISGRSSPHRPSAKVHAGEKVTIITPNDGMMEEEYWRGKLIDKKQDPEIIFEDDELLVINKPPYMITHPAGKNLFYCATVFYETIYKKTIHSIHRLDRETSGLLLLGKNPKISNQVSLLFEEDKVRKCYFFIASKRPSATSFPFTAKERMDREEGAIPRGIMFSYPENSSSGKPAETSFKLLMEKNNYVLALAFPVTGRQHQIRVHAACHGYPLLGDKLYYGDPTIFMRFKDNQATEEDHEKMEIPRQALHAVGLKIMDFAEKPSEFIAPLPQDLCEWMTSKLGVTRNEVEKIVTEKLTDFFNKV